MNKTDERIKKYIKQGLSTEQICKKIGRPINDELLWKRIKKLRTPPEDNKGK